MRRYYEEEMRYLHEEGKAFAAKHPEQAGLLNVDSISDRDPYVERLFEGFAFLAGRIHQRLDDELPEYTEGLFALLYPHFLRPVPALTMLELRPRSGQVSEPTVMPAGTEIRSEPSGDAGTVCRFRTTEDVTVRPMGIDSLAFSLEKDNTHNVTLSLRVFGGSRIAASNLNRLRLYFHADAQVASTMHLFFTRHVDRLTLRADRADESSEVSLPGQQWIVPGGFGRDEGVLPYSEFTFAGSRLLQEYLNFRARFWCVDVLGIDRVGELEGGDRLSVTVKFNREFPDDRRFQTNNVRLHCTPAINLFASDAEPIRVTHRETEFRVKSRMTAGSTEEIYDVVNVVGIEEKSGVRHAYEPFFSRKPKSASGRYFSQSFRKGPDDRRTAYLTLSYGEDQAGNLEPEILSLDVRSTNGGLPRELLRENSITVPGPDVPGIVDASNLLQPTQIRYAPTDSIRDFFWQLLSHLSLNRASILTPAALAEVLRLYDWSASDANRRRIQGIRGVRWDGRDLTLGGGVLRGGQVTIEVDEDHFSDEGDLCLFGLVMSEFLSMYATINSFIHLAIVAKPSERTYKWIPNRGKNTAL